MNNEGNDVYFFGVCIVGKLGVDLGRVGDFIVVDRVGDFPQDGSDFGKAFHLRFLLQLLVAKQKVGICIVL